MSSVSNHLVPMVVESDGRFERSFDIFSRLLRERIVFLGTEVDASAANLVVAQLLFLEAEDPDTDIRFYINSPGGDVYAGMAMYDAMQFVKPDVQTYCIGMAMSMGALLLAGQPFRPAKLEGDDPPGLRRHPRDARRHPDRRAGDPLPHAPLCGGDRASFRPGRRAGDERHRPRPLPRAGRGRGLRAGRLGPSVTQRQLTVSVRPVPQLDAIGIVSSD